MTYGQNILLFDHITLNAGSVDTSTFTPARLATLTEYFRVIFVADHYNDATGADPDYTPQIVLRVSAKLQTGDAYEYCLYPTDINGLGFTQDIRVRSGEYTQFIFTIENNTSSQLAISNIQLCPEWIPSNGVDGYNIQLDNSAMVYEGTTTAAVATSSVINVLAYRGGVRIGARIGTITGIPSGMSCTIRENNTNNANILVAVSVSTPMTTGHGTLTIPVTVDAVTTNLTWNWSITFKGADGRPGSDANVDFDHVNAALANLFVKTSQGDPTQVTDYYIYSPIIEGAEIYTSRMYAGQGEGFIMVEDDGLYIYDADGLLKGSFGYVNQSSNSYPYIRLGAGDNHPDTWGLFKKFLNGVWIGNAVPMNQAGNFVPTANCSGIFHDFINHNVYVVNGTSMIELYTGDAIARFG